MGAGRGVPRAMEIAARLLKGDAGLPRGCSRQRSRGQQASRCQCGFGALLPLPWGLLHPQQRFRGVPFPQSLHRCARSSPRPPGASRSADRTPRTSPARDLAAPCAPGPPHRPCSHQLVGSTAAVASSSTRASACHFMSILLLLWPGRARGAQGRPGSGGGGWRRRARCAGSKLPPCELGCALD